MEEEMKSKRGEAEKQTARECEVWEVWEDIY